jgi:O-antigen/teichoic acid export membrane protein
MTAWREGAKRLARRAWASPIRRGSTPLFVSNLFALAFSFAKSIALARGLGSAQFGLLTYAIALSMIAAQFISLRSGENIVRFVGAALARERPARAATFLHLGVGLDAATAVITLLAIRWLVLPGTDIHPSGEMLQPMISIYALAVPFVLLQSPFNALILTLKRFNAAAALRLMGPALELGAVLLGIPHGALIVIRNLSFATAAASCLTILTGAWLFWKRTKTWRGTGYRTAWKEMQPFAVSSGLLGTLKSLTTNLDVVVLGALRPASEVAFYELARRGVGILATIVAPLLQAVHPLMNEAWVRKELGRLRRLIGSFMLINGGIALSAAVFLLFTAHRLVLFFYGPQFIPAVGIMQILIIPVGLQAVFGWMRRMLLVAGYPKRDLAAGIIGSGSFVLLLVPFIYLWGAMGLAVLFLLNAMLMAVVFAWLGAASVLRTHTAIRETGRVG